MEKKVLEDLQVFLNIPVIQVAFGRFLSKMKPEELAVIQRKLEAGGSELEAELTARIMDTVPYLLNGAGELTVPHIKPSHKKPTLSDAGGE